jgi:hypothetical protein
MSKNDEIDREAHTPAAPRLSVNEALRRIRPGPSDEPPSVGDAWDAPPDSPEHSGFLPRVRALMPLVVAVAVWPIGVYGWAGMTTSLTWLAGGAAAFALSAFVSRRVRGPLTMVEDAEAQRASTADWGVCLLMIMIGVAITTAYTYGGPRRETWLTSIAPLAPGALIGAIVFAFARYGSAGGSRALLAGCVMGTIGGCGLAGRV